MGLMKRALEQLSEEMGRDGLIDEEVLAEAEADPERFAAAARTMRTRLGLPAVATPTTPHATIVPTNPIGGF